MEFTYCLDDIAIAQAHLADSRLLSAVSTDELICDIYVLPSHNHQTYYVQLYKDAEGFVLLFAKTYIATPIGLECVMYSFQDALKADEHIGCKGDVFCGMHRITSDNQTIKTLISVLPKFDEMTDDKAIRIDGVTTIVRKYEEQNCVSLGYHDANEIETNSYTDEQRKFLDSLYIYLERIIGNLLVSSGKWSPKFLTYE